MSYRCATCGELHEDLPDIGRDKPDRLAVDQRNGITLEEAWKIVHYCMDSKDRA